MTTAFATVLHDPDALLVAPLEAAATQLRSTFDGIAVSLTESTHQAVEWVLTNTLGARLRRHPTGEQFIGLGRRAAVELATAFGTAQILYADPDHMLHWLRDDPDELRAVLAAQPGAGLLIVGRSPKAFADWPERLQQTEAPINRAYELATGRHADLLAAVRRMSLATARDVVAHSRADSYANDVEWPILAERLGHRIGYFPADGLKYRTIEEFGAPADTLDGDPLQWVRRIEMAAVQARVLRQLLQSGD